MKKVSHIYLDYSSYSEYLKCPRKFVWSLVEGLEPNRIEDPSQAAFFKGTVIHECIDAEYSGGDWRGKFHDLLLPEYSIHSIPGYRSGSVSHLELILERYMDYYNCPDDNEYVITATEQRFEMPLAPWLTWVGTVDKVAISRADEKMVIIDHKTSSSLSRFMEPTIAVSDQFTGYLALAQANGLVTDTLVIDGISTAKKALDENVGLFCRYTTHRTDSDIEEFKTRALKVATRIKEDIETGEWISNQPAACNLFNSRCQFYDACATSGSARANLIRNDFRKTSSPWKNFTVQWET